MHKDVRHTKRYQYLLCADMAESKTQWKVCRPLHLAPRA